jgi:hypothetical protein
MEQMVQSAVQPLGSSLRVNWLRGLFDHFQNASLQLGARLLDSKSLRCLVLKESIEETHYKGRTIETTVYSDGLWSWHAQHTVGPTLDGTGERTFITTGTLSAYSQAEALALAIQDIRELIDSRLT